MLDDQNVIAQRDPAGLLRTLGEQPQQLGADFGIARQRVGGMSKNIVFVGVGGSALPAEYALSHLQLQVPLLVCQDYHLPAWVNHETLVICASYSSDAEETLAALSEAEEKGAAIAIITHDDDLAKQARTKGHMLASLPTFAQPRASVLAVYRALCEILVAAGFCHSSVSDELVALIEPLQMAITGWLPSVPSSQNEAKQLADHCAGKTPIIYAGPLMFAAAHKWKIGFNQNAKNTAWCSRLPESNHNELTGWSSHPIEKPFAVFDLLSHFEHPRVLRSFEITDRLLSGQRPKATEVHSQGANPLEQLLYLALLGDFVSTYAAILNGVNPSPEPLAERFKKELVDYKRT